MLQKILRLYAIMHHTVEIHHVLQRSGINEDDKKLQADLPQCKTHLL
jgi:hypothetical protein